MSIEKEPKGITRRTFITGTTIGAAGIVVSSSLLAGCGADEADQNKSDVDSAQGQTPEFMKAPDPIPDSKIKQTIEMDVCVVGSGTAGIVAALSAREAGAKVVVLEKYSTFRYGGGYNAAINSKFQQNLGINIDTDQVMRDLMRYQESRPSESLIRLWANHSGEIADWWLAKMEAAGEKAVVFAWPEPKGYDTKEFGYEYPTAINVAPEKVGDKQKIFLEVLHKDAVKQGVDIRFSTPAVQLIQSSDGKVTGVIAKDKSGNYIKVSTKKAVILCTGDYGSNEEMAQYYQTSTMAQLAKANIYTSFMDEQPKERLNVGDGQKMCLWVGGQMEEGPHASMAWNLAEPMEAAIMPFLRVNGLGERYEREETNMMQRVNALERQPGKKAWVIFDSKYVEDSVKMGFFFMGGSMTMENATEAIEKNCIKANTLDELAQKLKMPAATLKATVARRNELAQQGNDTDYGVLPQRLYTIEKAPFYAARITAGLAVTLGGIKVNDKLQPRDKDGKAIPGLYLAGNTVGERYGLFYTAVCPGISNGLAWTHGYFAGKWAAEQA
ncbi:MAG TPA: FAD-dependent oxidoreductase [Syntrophomonas sp.]|nr:FAD-dependent oxidoreductase [Syntrophomonas sp.]